MRVRRSVVHAGERHSLERQIIEHASEPPSTDDEVGRGTDISPPPAVPAATAPAVLQAQQLPQLTQYQFNDYVFNPAVAGSRQFFELRSGHRYQWVGIQDAPRTFTLSGTTPIGKNMGVGGYIFTDIVGPTRRTGVQFSYAYHLKLTEDLKLSLALSGGLLQFLIDGSKITLHDQGDPTMDDQLRGELKPDATFAFYLYHRRERLEQVRQALADGASAAPDPVQAVVERVYADVPREVWPAAALSVAAQLEYLRTQSD